jgi:hypothetical protein
LLPSAAPDRDADDAEIGIRDADRPRRRTATLGRDGRQRRCIADELDMNRARRRQINEVVADAFERRIGTSLDLAGGVLEAGLVLLVDATVSGQGLHSRRCTGERCKQQHEQEHQARHG